MFSLKTVDLSQQVLREGVEEVNHLRRLFCLGKRGRLQQQRKFGVINGWSAPVGLDGTNLAITDCHQVKQPNTTTLSNSDCDKRSEETHIMTSTMKKLVAGILVAASFVAAGVTVMEVPQLATESQTIANRYHLRSRTSNFYNRASRSSNSNRSKSGGFRILSFGR